MHTSEHVTMLPLWEWVPTTETTLRAGFRKFPHSYFRVGTPTFFVSRVLIQIIQPATVTAHSISKAHTYCTDRTVIKTTVSSLCESFVKL